jgi:hypothetical protein
VNQQNVIINTKFSFDSLISGIVLMAGEYDDSIIVSIFLLCILFRFSKNNDIMVVVVLVVFTQDHGSKPHKIYQSTVQVPHHSWASCHAVYQY